MRSEQPSPNFVFLGDLQKAAALPHGVDRLAQVAVETNATTVGKLARDVREREARA